MKKVKFAFLSFMFVLILSYKPVFCAEQKTYATYTAKNLTITSYSKAWDKDKLKDLYLELINNFHGDEFEYLSDIYIYSNSPEGVNGHYFDDIYFKDGNYILGKNAYINLYNGDRYNTIKEIAYSLAHEYGHHYMAYNLALSEGIYHNNVKDSKYFKIRKLEKTPVIYKETSKYIYYWDIWEIMADDYVQLLGSSNARASIYYKSVDELKEENLPLYENVTSFNVKPQLNPYIPLASQVNGLYTYMLNIAGFTLAQPKKPILPTINNVKGYVNSNNEINYNISFDDFDKNMNLEYTLVVYPKENPFVPYPLKTLTSKENKNVNFGSYTIKDKYGKQKIIQQKFDGLQTFRIYVKDTFGFIYSSEPKTINFDIINKNILKNKQKNKKQIYKDFLKA